MVRFWIVTVMAALGSGTFKLDIDAAEDLRYVVIVCDEIDPSCKNWRRSG